MDNKVLAGVLLLGVLLNVVIEQTGAQNLRWGKRELEDPDADFQYNNLQEKYDTELRNKRQNLRWGKRDDLEKTFLELLRQAYNDDKYEKEGGESSWE